MDNTQKNIVDSPATREGDGGNLPVREDSTSPAKGSRLDINPGPTDASDLLGAPFQQSIIDALETLLLVLNGEGQIIASNKAWKMWAKKSADFQTSVDVGTNYVTVCQHAAEIGNTDALHISAGLVGVLAGAREEFTYEYACNTASSQEWFQLKVTPLPAPFQGAVMTHTNITKLWSADLQIRRLFSAVEQSPSAVVITDPQGHIEYVNPKFSETTGFSPDEVIGQNAGILKAGKTPSEVYRHLWDTIIAGSSWQGEFHKAKKNGDLYWEKATITPIADRTGRITNFLAVQEDITAAREIAEELRLSEARYRSLFNALTEGIALYDADGQITTWNASAEHILGVNADEIKQWHLIDGVRHAISPDGQPFCLDDLPAVQTLRTGLPCNGVVMGIPRANGAVNWISISSQPIFHDNAERPHAVAVLFSDITEQLAQEAALRESEARYRTIVEMATEGLCLVKAEGTTTFVNPQLAQLLGYASPSELYGVHIARLLISRNGSEEITRHLARCRLGTTDRTEFELIRRDGSTIWVMASSGPQYSGLGNFTGMLTMITDITQLKQFEQSLRASQDAERAQRVLAEALRDTAAILTSTLNPNDVLSRILETIGRVLPCDRASILLVEGNLVRPAYFQGWLPEEETEFSQMRLPVSTSNLAMMARTGQPMVIPDIWEAPEWNSVVPEVRSYAGAPIRSREQVVGFLDLLSNKPGYFTMAHAERLQMFADQVAIAVENAQLYDELWRHAGVLQETVLERTAELRLAKEQAEAIFNSSLTSIVVTDVAGVIQKRNPAYHKMFNTDGGPTIKQKIEDLTVEAHQEILRVALRRVTGNALTANLDIVAQRCDDTLFEANLTLAPIWGHDDQVTGVVCNFQDITPYKQVERELQELNKLKTDFLSTAAHELRTPLTSVRGFSEILLTRELNAERRLRYLQLINTQSTQLGHIIDDLLDISRLEARRELSLEMSLHNLCEVARGVFLLFMETAPHHTIKFEPAGPCDIYVLGDSFRLEQVIKNLLSNAVKYSPNGGEIIIRVGRAENMAMVSVVDHGIGITPEQQAHLFEKFYRADSSGTAVNGTGLGLAICRLIIELHRGRIWLESEYGSGTTFHFALPLAHASSASVSSQFAPDEPAANLGKAS